jgi:hypothetical protein
LLVFQYNPIKKKVFQYNLSFLLFYNYCWRAQDWQNFIIFKKIKFDQNKVDILIPTAKTVGKTIPNISLTVGRVLRCCPTVETTVAIAYSDGKFPWVKANQSWRNRTPVGIGFTAYTHGFWTYTNGFLS